MFGGAWLWRLSPSWWLSFPKFVLTDMNQGCNMAIFKTYKKTHTHTHKQLQYITTASTYNSNGATKKACLDNTTFEHALSSRQRVAAIASARLMFDVWQKAHTSIRQLQISFKEDVLDSHGNHIPRLIFESATFAFWVPDLIRFAALPEHLDTSSHFWRPRIKSFGRVLPHILKMLPMFEWPGLPTYGDVVAQYVSLSKYWAVVCAQDGHAQ